MSQPAMLEWVLDQPDDTGRPGIYADFLTEHCPDDPVLQAHARLIYAQVALAEIPARAERIEHVLLAASSRLRDEEQGALRDRHLDLLPERRVDAQVIALRRSTIGCCDRHADQMACDCLTEAVTATLERGFITQLAVSFLPTFVRAGDGHLRLADVLRHHPVRRIVLTDAGLQVEIDRWEERRDGGAVEGGWQAHFYNAGRPSPHESDYFHTESWEHRAELVDNLEQAIAHVVVARTVTNPPPEADNGPAPAR